MTVDRDARSSTTGATLLPAGPDAWLIEVTDGAAARALHRHLLTLRERGELRGVVDLVPGARTVLVDGGCLPRSRLAGLLREWRPARNRPRPAGPVLPIPVCYDGADLDEVGRLTRLTRDEIVAAHTSTELTVAFCGFAPGFAYLTGLPPCLRVPRRSAPRTSVPAGAVALADEYTGIYPRNSPGGWQLIGHTTLTLWDTERVPPALLTPGTRVRFSVAR